MKVLDRFFSFVDKTPTCWLWTGPTTGKSGYGRFWVGNQGFQAHRYIYEQLIDLIPKNLQLDHLCRVRLCVNPKHLEPVTGRENQSRGNVNQNKNKTHL